MSLMLSNNPSPRPNRNPAKEQAHRLIAFYPAIAASDPTVFVAGLVMLFSSYPLQVVEAVLSPISGIPAKYKFFPSIAEVKSELEERYAPILRAIERERACNQT